MSDAVPVKKEPVKQTYPTPDKKRRAVLKRRRAVYDTVENGQSMWKEGKK